MRLKRIGIGVGLIVVSAAAVLAAKPNLIASSTNSQTLSFRATDSSEFAARRCPRELVTLPLDRVTVETRVAQDRRSALVSYKIRYAQERYTSAWLTKMQPRTSQPDATWYSVGAVACPRGPDESGPTSVGEARGSLDIRPVQVGSVCQGSSGIALLGDTTIRRLPGTALTCTLPPVPSPEGKIISGIYFDNCTRQGQVWTCRRRPVYVHTRGKSECGRWLIEDKHEFEAFMTAGAGAGDQRVNVQNMTLSFTIMDGSGHVFERGTQNCPNTSWCAKTIKHYNLGCRAPRIAQSTARHGNATWQSQPVSW